MAGIVGDIGSDSLTGVRLLRVAFSGDRALVIDGLVIDGTEGLHERWSCPAGLVLPWTNIYGLAGLPLP